MKAKILHQITETYLQAARRAGKKFYIQVNSAYEIQGFIAKCGERDILQVEVI